MVFQRKGAREMKAAKLVGKQLQEFSLRLVSHLCIFVLGDFLLMLNFSKRSQRELKKSLFLCVSAALCQRPLLSFVV
jgi:hypothetical protein